MLYFAYGSNLSPARLQRRVPSAMPVAAGVLERHRLLFHKIGRDGSAKCNASYTGLTEDIVLGAVYRIDPAHKTLLDEAEGLGRGYEIKQVRIVSHDGGEIVAFTYFATRITSGLLPFRWYKEHVLRGAREHGFPEPYIRAIISLQTVDDHDAGREETELGIYL